MDDRDSVYVAAWLVVLVALVQALVLLLILKSLDAFLDSFVLAFAAITVVIVADNFRFAVGRRGTINFGIALVVAFLFLAMVVTMVGKAELTGNGTWRFGAYAIQGLGVAGATTYRSFLARAQA